MKRVLGLLLALAVMVSLSSVPSFSQPQETKTEKGEKKKAEKGDKKGEKKGKKGDKKGEKKNDSSK
jgi:hypothetical protein